MVGDQGLARLQKIVDLLACRATGATPAEEMLHDTVEDLPRRLGEHLVEAQAKPSSFATEGDHGARITMELDAQLGSEDHTRATA